MASSTHSAPGDPVSYPYCYIYVNSHCYFNGHIYFDLHPDRDAYSNALTVSVANGVGLLTFLTAEHAESAENFLWFFSANFALSAVNFISPFL